MNLGIQILEGRGLQSLLISCCYLQWLGHLWQLCVVFYMHFDTSLVLYCFLQSIWHICNSLLFFTINRRLQSVLVVFYKSLLCRPILWGPASQALAISNRNGQDIPTCSGSIVFQLGHGQFSIGFYNQLEASFRFSCFLQEFVVLSHSAGARIAGTRDLKSQ